MKKILVLFSCFAFLTPMLCPVPAHAGGEGIAAVVNSDVVTSSDLNERMRLIGASTGIIRNPEMMQKLKPQVLDMLVEEALKVQAAKAINARMSPAEIDAGFAEVAGNNNVDADTFKSMLQSAGINARTMRDQIKAQIGWSKVIKARIRPKIEVSDSDIDAELEKLKTKIGHDQYHVAQIMMPLTNPKKEPDLKNFITRLGQQLQTEPENFGKAAQQFSQAPGAKQGGDSGWIEDGQLSPELFAVISRLQPGQISPAVKSQNTYYLFLVKERRQLTAEMLPSREDLLQKLGTQRMERAARRYLLDLRSTAFIETRA